MSLFDIDKPATKKKAGLGLPSSSSYGDVIKKSKSSDVVKRLAKMRRQGLDKKSKPKLMKYKGPI